MAVLALLALGWRRSPNRVALLAGSGLVALALLSPLCSLAVALFSARVAQHMALVLIAAPLLAVGLRARAPSAPVSASVFAAMLWLWHLPAPYGWTFTSDLAWWASHLSLLVAAVWLWQALLHARPESALAAGIVTAAQMGVLGAFLTFAPRPLYLPHAFTTWPWGLSALEDQQLGGLLMWVPGGVLFAGLALAAVARALREARPAG
ncbi:cytochrome c oxidase assembly protein [Sabulicella glaciei]|uniref:Cytochrome c oxidase assembly protein n=1 Tax=Sabulicella glaciei TaxID=2984948 RepID=A0ABT3NRJ7_9PROT|nr:cytochrome c oxidase assembly protein [Roseococcus sp. MDT2-1-1]MCW8084785.1 cytochrome c oxidase assembly protein [Roseococcus sp. MDT2-1-1]